MDFSVILPELLKQGAGYVIAAVFAWFSWQLYKENRQNYKDQLISQKADTDKAWAALNASASAQQAGAEAMKQLKEVVDTAILKGGRR